MKTKFALLYLTIIFSLSDALAQKFLILDSYGLRRTKLYVGDDIIFRTHDTALRYKGIVVGLLDSAILVSGISDSIPLKNIHTFYFRRRGVDAMRTGFKTFTTGFLGAALVHPLIPNAGYSAKESAIIGASFFTISQFARFFVWRKFKLKHKKRRARIIDLDGISPSVS
jgi:hypothetical protein